MHMVYVFETCSKSHLAVIFLREMGLLEVTRVEKKYILSSQILFN